MSPGSRAPRGFSSVEVLVVAVILGMLMTLLVSSTLPILRAQSRGQAKLDTMQSAAVALYRIQRDLRQTYYLSAYACTTGTAAVCSQPASFASTTAVAFPTAYANGNGQFQIQTAGPGAGQPNWQGVMVYWIDSSNALNWGFERPLGFVTGSSALSSTVAATAVADLTSGATAGNATAIRLQQLALALNPGSTNIVSLSMQAIGVENGSTNSATYRTDILTRQ